MELFKRLARPQVAIYIDRVASKQSLPDGSRRVLIVLFIPSVQRDGATPVPQDDWVERGLQMFGTVFGGGTAYPKARGVWRDDERNGALVFDEPVVLHCYVTEAAVEDDSKLEQLAAFCRLLGRATNQGEVGLVISDEYFAITDF